ncbi:MAG: UbiA family prenyltransferase [Xanthomonadales bacterium]|nr:UbiA family prenyltransferase [Xanthomonadales bacterium]
MTDLTPMSAVHTKASTASSEPLLIPLEYSLVLTDPAVEAAFGLLRAHARHLFLLPVWRMQGREAMNRRVADRILLDPAALPYDAAVLAELQIQHACGRELVLVTRSDRRHAQQIADHLGIFSQVLSADEAIRHAGTGASTMPVSAFPLPAYLKSLRLHQWLKNLLLFVPLVMSHQISNINLLMNAAIAFLAFGLCASSAYLLNDLLDLADDRRHPDKRHRPLAAGQVSARACAWGIPVLLAASAALGLLLPAPFLALLGTYYLGTLLYSLWLKRVILVDVLSLVGLYTLRLLAGAAAVSVTTSFWLLAFAVFVFLSLAMVKRYVELQTMAAMDRTVAAGRGYRIDDLETISQFGSASGYMAVLVLALYINSDTVRVLYDEPRIIWLLCPLVLYLISRIWLLARRGEIHEDPVVFAIEDRQSQVLAVLGALLLWLAA